jgi:YegS/Rv2252/BmrU family lipid kinase
MPEVPLDPETQKYVTIIFNPVSGREDPEQRKKIISEKLAEQGYRCQFIATTKEQGAKALAAQAVKEGVDLLAVSGGDGTVMEAMAALVGTQIPIAVFPAGTGNLLSINLGIPMTVPDAVTVALSGHTQALDLVRTGDGHYFAIMGGLGLDAQMIADTSRQAKAKMGKLAYFVSAFKNLPRRRAYVDITLDDGPPLRRRVKSILLANMGKITGGLDVMPTATPRDGLLDVGIFKTATLGQGLRLLGYALLGCTQNDPDMEVYQVKKVTLRARFPELVQFDGEDGGYIRELTAEIVPNAVQIFLPENSPAAHDLEVPPAEAAQRTAKRRLLVPVALLSAAIGTLLLWKRSR